MKKPSITAIIIAKNEAEMIANCLNSLRWCDDIIVLDNKSDDDTVELAKQLGARVFQVDFQSFSKWREAALDKVKTDWIFYIDPDERVTPQLAQEILEATTDPKISAISMLRQNQYYGHKLKFGAAAHDQVTRAFKVSEFKGWSGSIHESPIFSGKTVELQNKLIHLTHRDTASGLKKSANWTIKEALPLAKSLKTPVTFKTIIRKGLMQFYRLAWKQKGYKDGMPGMVEALIQAINRMVVYIQVWELQHKPSIKERYNQEELRIHQLWQQSKINQK